MDAYPTLVPWLQDFITRQVPIWEIPVVLGIQFLAVMFVAWRANVIRSAQFKRLIVFALSTFVPTVFFAVLCSVFAFWGKDPSITQGDVLPGVAGSFGFTLFLASLKLSSNLAKFPPECTKADFHRGFCRGLKHVSIVIVVVATILFSINHLLDSSHFPFWVNGLIIAINASIIIGCYNGVWAAGAASVRIDDYLVQKPSCTCGKHQVCC